MEEDFKVDLKQLVEDLQVKTNRLQELEKEKSDLYLKIAQNITKPVEEPKPKEDEIPFNDLITELGKGI